MLYGINQAQKLNVLDIEQWRFLIQFHFNANSVKHNHVHTIYGILPRVCFRLFFHRYLIYY